MDLNGLDQMFIKNYKSNHSIESGYLKLLTFANRKVPVKLFSEVL